MAAAVNRFISLNPGHLRVGKVTEAATSTTTDLIELRMLITDTTPAATNLTRFAVIQALEVFKNYLKMGGYIEFNNAASGGLPQPAPGPTIVA